MAPNDVLTVEQLRNILDYNPETGHFTWRLRDISSFRNRRAMMIWNAKYPERIAGTIENKGYVQIKINNKAYLGHRLAWFLNHGEWAECVDHIDGDPTNNSISNLRSVSRAVNQRNQKQHKNNSSGFTGVTKNRHGKWVASIRVDNQQKFLGSFWLFDDAVSARKRANAKYGFSERN